LVEYGDIDIVFAKGLADGKWVGLSNKTVSAIFADGFYIEEPNRSGGILVKPSGGVPLGLAIGDIVDLAGQMSTNTAGERWIEQ
jgi:hypothetical protein